MTFLQGDALAQLRTLPADSVQCVVTSPPYWGLRDYGVEGQIGLESTPEAFTARLVEVFREVRRVLRPDGTCWMNLGDSYASNAGGYDSKTCDPRISAKTMSAVLKTRNRGTRPGSPKHTDGSMGPMTQPNRMPIAGLKPKDLVGIPWRVAFALQADGWWLRQDIIWHKPNPMPESVRDRCTKAHEYLFLLTKSERYFFDQEAILEPVSPNTHARLSQNVQDQIGSERANGGAKTNGNMKAVSRGSWKGSGFDTGKTAEHHDAAKDAKGLTAGRKLAEPGGMVKNNGSFDAALAIMPDKRNKRSVWTIPTFAMSEAHFATFPPALVQPCILAGTRLGDVVLDPFLGSGTTAMVALELGRRAIGIELNPEYLAIARRRMPITPGLL